ncbi:MAG: two-component system, OmpR family, sensor histidine kinase KdpD [Chloroflexia bacterium]|nr:two-component system, OmpR family, sensor histidine kinase KdpD [Chloroflexia bacterium]
MKAIHAHEIERSLRTGTERFLNAARNGLVGRDGVLSIDGLDAAVRTFGVGTVLALSLLGYGRAGGHFSDGLADPVGVAFGLVLYNILVILILGVPFRRPPSFSLFLVDWIMVSTSVLLTGGFLSPFIILYYALGIGAALRVGFSRSMLLVGACSVVYIVLGLVTDANLGAAKLPIAVIEIASLFMVVLTGVGMRNALEVEARRVQLEEQSAGQLRLLNSLINTVLSASPDLEEVMRTVASVSSQALQSDSGLAVLFSEQVTTSAESVASQGEHAVLLVSNKNPNPPQLSAIEADLLSRAVTTQAPVVLSASEPDPAFRHFPGLERDGARLCSLVCVPFLLEGRSIGGLFVGRFDQRRFTPAETGLLMAISSQVAVAVRLARLYEMECEKAARSEERERLERDLLSMVSHELRTPLTSIKTCIGALSDMSPAPDAAAPEATQARLLQNIGRSTERLIGLVNELLDMARLRAGRVSLQMQQVHVGSLITDLLGQVAPLVEGRGQTLVVDLPPAGSERWGHLNVAGDRRRLEQVLINLVANANKYSPPHSKITMGATQRDGEVRIFVRDEGPGIPQREQPRIFDKFYTGTAPESPESLGLGLAIARSIVELHGGTMGLSSRPGSGSTFYFTLPLFTEDEAVVQGVPQGKHGAIHENTVG